MKTLALGAAVLMLAMTGCKSRSYNTTSSVNQNDGVDFVLPNDPKPDALDDFGAVSGNDSDFVLPADASPDTDFQ